MATQGAITIFRGEETTLNFTMAPVEDITGWTIQFTVAKAAESPVKVIPTMAMTVTNGAQGLFQVVLDADLTKDLKSGSYYWDAWRVDTDQEKVLAYGSFKILAPARLPPAS